jgi:hypothetical protein
MRLPKNSVTGVIQVPLAGQHQLVVDRRPDRSLVHLRGGAGISLTIEITASGPVLRFQGPALAIDAGGALAISAETIAIHARQGLQLSAGGDARVAVGGDLEVTAAAQALRARLGDVAVRANDDVTLNGARVLLNC